MMRLLALVLLWSAAASSQPPFFFLQMSDPQFGMYTDNAGFAHETANFEFAIATANRLKPAFVVVTGDLINQPGDAAQANEYKRIVGQLDPSIKLYSVPGNHDVQNEPTPESLARYRERFGPDYYTFRAGDMAGFVLDSSLEKAPQHVAGEAGKQEAWLRAELAKARQDGVKHLVVFQHHPLFLKDPQEPEQYFNIGLETRQRYLSLLREYGVKWVFAGHYHRNDYGRDGDLQMVTTGPVGKPLEGGRSGMRLAVLKGGVFEQRYLEFGDLPESIQ